MGWKRTLRSIQAAARQAERESRRQQRELQRRMKEAQREDERELAAMEVEIFENELEVLNSVHKDCPAPIDWTALRNAPPPPQPQCKDEASQIARTELEHYTPGFFVRVLGLEGRQRRKLEERLQAALQAEQQRHQQSLAAHAQAVEQWQEQQELAGRVLAGDANAYHEVVDTLASFEELAEVDTVVTIIPVAGQPTAIEARLMVAEKSIVPSHIKSITKTGKLSTRAMPKGRGNEIYQDYVCGSALRVAREVVALLPISHAVVTTTTPMLNTGTGHVEPTDILSIIAPRATVQRLNFDSLDPSDAMENFLHRMSFKKTKGFAPVDRLTAAEIPTSE